MIGALELPLNFERQLCEEARRSLPRECCGLIEGRIDGAVACATMLHPMPNVADAPDAFEIDPASHIVLLRHLRRTGGAIIGCYHSHPNGRAEPSERDRGSAIETGLLWLICAIETGTLMTSIAAFVSAGHSFAPVGVVRVGEAPARSGVDRVATSPI